MGLIGDQHARECRRSRASEAGVVVLLNLARALRGRRLLKAVARPSPWYLTTGERKELTSRPAVSRSGGPVEMARSLFLRPVAVDAVRRRPARHWMRSDPASPNQPPAAPARRVQSISISNKRKLAHPMESAQRTAVKLRPQQQKEGARSAQPSPWYSTTGDRNDFPGWRPSASTACWAALTTARGSVSCLLPVVHLSARCATGA
jgi:hypothetical protein